MSDLQAIQDLLARAARRQRWQRAWNDSCQGLRMGGLVWLAALALFKLAPIPFSVVIGAGLLAGFCVAAGFFRGWFRPLNLQQTAQCVDDRRQLQERLSTALELAGGGDENWRALLVADAARFAEKIDPRQVFPYRLPGVTHWALLILALGAGLGFVPEYRTKAYRQKKQDAAAIKEVAKKVVEITHRNLEQRPPVLEPARRAIEAAEETGLRLNKNPLTRNDAIKDLANVADKLKEQMKELGQKNPEFKKLEQEARNPSGQNNPGSAEQKQLDALQKALEKSGENSEALSKLESQLQNLEKAMAGLPKDNSAASSAARQKMAENLGDIARQAAALGQSMPNLDEAIAALKANKLDDFQRDLGATTTDLEKLKKLAKAMEKMQAQSEKQGRDLSEQLKFGQPDAARRTLKKMIDKLNSGGLNREELAKMLDEVSRSVNPASPYGKTADHLKQAAGQMQQGDKAGAAQSLAQAAKELERIDSELADARELQQSLDAVNAAELALATRRTWGEASECKGGEGACARPGGSRGGHGVGAWTEDDSTLYPEMSELWDNSGVNRGEMDARGLTDRGDPKLSDKLAATKVHGQIAPGSPMPSISLKGVSIKGTSSVSYQEAAAAAQSDAQSALNQDQVPRAYQGAVKDYFNDLKNQ